MRNLLFAIIILAALAYGLVQRNSDTTPVTPASYSDSERQLHSAFNNRKSNLQVQGKGTVIKILVDDLSGSRHQRFVLRLDSGLSLLIAHNIDLAPRIRDLKKGDVVSFFGEYEWNPKGGIIHWTHADPRKIHVAGWLKHKGKTYH